jgi:hypothetical protein
MMLRVTIGSLAVLFASGAAISAGQPGRFLEEGSGVYRAEEDSPLTDDPHPVLQRQREIPARTTLINDIDSDETPRRVRNLDWGAPVQVRKPAGRTATPARAARYQISVTPEGTLLLDVQSGRTWLLDSFEDEKPVWKRIEREDD